MEKIIFNIILNIVKRCTHLNNKLRIEKEHISTPLPVMAEKMPPQKPVKINVNACQIPKLGI